MRRGQPRLDCAAVLPRVWIALLALLLLAAPAAAPSAEVPDPAAPFGLCVDAAPLIVQELPADERAPESRARLGDEASRLHRPLDRTTRPAPRAERAPPVPELARVFRPPRAARG